MVCIVWRFACFGAGASPTTEVLQMQKTSCDLATRGGTENKHHFQSTSEGDELRIKEPAESVASESGEKGQLLRFHERRWRREMVGAGTTREEEVVGVVVVDLPRKGRGALKAQTGWISQSLSGTPPPSPRVTSRPARGERMRRSLSRAIQQPPGPRSAPAAARRYGGFAPLAVRARTAGSCT